MSSSSDREDLLLKLNRAADIASAVLPLYRPAIDARVALWLRRLFYFRGRYVRHSLAKLGLTWGDGVQATTFWSRKLTLPLADFDSQYLYWLGFLPLPEELRLTRFLIKNLRPDDIFYDVGASYGFYTWLAQELAPHGEVHVFEPSPEVFPFLRSNAGSDPQLYLNALALSNRQGSVAFYQQTAHHSGVSTLIEEVAAAHSAQFRKTEVPAVTLDQYLEGHSLPTTIKLDVEGAECAVIEGGARFLARASPTIALEIWPGELGQRFSRPAVEALGALGYQAQRILSDGTTAPLDQIFPCADGDNLIFTRRPP